MLDRTNHVRDLEIKVVNDTCQMIETCAIASLHHMVLFVGPFKGTIAANDIVESTLSGTWHLQANDRLPAFCQKCGFLFRRIRHELPIVDVRFSVLLGLFLLRFQFFWLRIIDISVAGLQKLGRRGLIARGPLRLKVRYKRTAHFRPLVPRQPQPLEAIQNGL